MELAAVVRQLMERSLEASVRAETRSFADHALVETLVALLLARSQFLQGECDAHANLPQTQCDDAQCLSLRSLMEEERLLPCSSVDG